MQALKNYCRDPETKKPKRGALARFADAMKVSLGTVHRWHNGLRVVPAKRRKEIIRLITRGLKLRQKKRCDAGQKRNPRKNLRHASS